MTWNWGNALQALSLHSTIGNGHEIVCLSAHTQIERWPSGEHDNEVNGNEQDTIDTDGVDAGAGGPSRCGAGVQHRRGMEVFQGPVRSLVTEPRGVADH